MISRLTLYEIAGNPGDVVVTHGGPSEENGKYVGWITRGPGRRYKPLISTSPIFDTPVEAEAAMQKIVDFAKNFTEEDLEKPNNPLSILVCLSPESWQVVKEIIMLAKS